MSCGEAALDIARALAADAIWHAGRCIFAGAAAADRIGDPPRFRTTGPDLYEGTAGIARFLAHAAAWSGDGEVGRTALGAARHALGCPAEDWSLFSGGAGVGVAALDVARSLDAPELVAPAVERIEAASVAALAADDAGFDLLAGVAGVIMALVWALPYDLDGGWRARAFDLGRKLMGQAHALDADAAGPIAWPLGPGATEYLCGLAHGAAGAALALDALGRLAPGEPGWAAAARRARDYERIHYDPAAGSFADLRPPEPGQPAMPPTHPHMWCHGSIGIAAERLRATGWRSGQADADRLARADLAGALAGARRFGEHIARGAAGPGAGQAANVSQCHGVGGLIDLLLDVAAASGDAGSRVLAEDLGALMLNDARREGGWRSGVPGGWRTPGLMLGDAGAGWALLRLARPGTPAAWELRLDGP